MREPDLTIVLDSGERVEVYVSRIGQILIGAILVAFLIATHISSGVWLVLGFSHFYLFYGCLMKFYFVLLDQRVRRLQV